MLGWSIVLAGKNTNSLWTTGADLVTLYCQEFKPSLQVTQESIEGGSGSFNSKRLQRLKFNVVPAPFKVNPTSTEMDNRTYFELMKVLGRRYQRITAISGNFQRINKATTGLISSGFISALPIDVQVLSVSELDSDYTNGNNTMTFELVSNGKYEW
jgi:hypothetical protein